MTCLCNVTLAVLQPESSARTSDCPSARSGTAGESRDVISRDGLSQKRRKAFTAVGKAGVSDPGTKPPPCPGSPRVLTAPALCLWPLLLNTAGCPDVRDRALGEVPVQTTPTARVYHLPCRTVTSLDTNCGSFSSKSPMGAQRVSGRRNALKLHQDFSTGMILPFSCL